MAITLPTPLRVAAGIVASGIDLVRSLPEEIPALPVTLVGKAMQLSMKVQQEIADLATKGDELLSGLLGGPQENPPWAQFDDEPPPNTAVAAAPRQKDSTPPARPGGTRPGGAGSARAGAVRAGAAATTRVAEGGKAPVLTPLARSARLDPSDADAPAKDDSKPTAAKPPADKAAEKAKNAKDEKDEKDEKDDEPKQDTAEPELDDVADDSRPESPGLEHPPVGEAEAEAEPRTEPAVDDVATAEVGPDAADPSPESEPAADPAVTADAGYANGEAPASTTDAAEEPDDGPDALPDYDRMTLAQVRGYLRSLSAQEVQTLLDHEQSGENRAPFLTLLSNRLVTLEHQES